MANDPKKPVIGERVIDASELTFLVDLEPGARVTLRTPHPGLDEAVAEILANQEVGNGADVVPQTTITELVTTTEQIRLIDDRLPALRKLVETMDETRAVVEDKRVRLVSAVANIADAQAKGLGDDSIRARYEKTRAYRSALGLKAAATRRRNQAEEDDQVDEIGEQPSETAPTEPPTPVETAPVAPVVAAAVVSQRPADTATPE
ncbi:hypothetical protein [Haliangium sp.]|uniref:hypothetical protein n=1 Tax=Haliangium sp. TaxID=2663208 RepID=UPI003D0961ED